MATSKKGKSGRKKAPAVLDVDESGQIVNTWDDDDAEDGSGEGEIAPGDGEPLDEVDVREADSVLTGLVDKKEKTRSTGSIAKHDPLTAYMQEAKRFPLLSREEEHELAVRYREDEDLAAARRLVESNLRLVVKIAYEYRRAHKNLLDLIQEGNIGLMQAVRKYDPYRGVKLSSYAAWWIRAYILKFILNNYRLVKIGTTQAQRKLFFNLKKERDKLEQLGFRPEPKLLAERLDVSEKEVIEMEKRMSSPDASLDAPLRADDDGSRTRLDTMESKSASRPDVAAERNQFQAVLAEKLDAFAATLEGREMEIFEDRWRTEDPLTLQELGDRFGVSRERTRQLEKRMMNRLRKYLEDELGTAVDIDAMSPD